MRHSVEEIKLKNGARGLFVDVEGASVMNFQFNFRAGNKFAKSKKKYETAHLMEHLAFGANASFKDEASYEAEFTKNGAYHNAWTGDVDMTYVAECADFEWERVLDLQKLAIVSPKFCEEELEAEKGNVRNELVGYQNKYSRLLWPKLYQVMGEDILTYKERVATIRNITTRDVREFWRRTHTGGNMRFVVAGKLDSGRRRTLKKMLEGWELGEGERLNGLEDNYVGTTPLLIRRKDAKNVSFGWSMIVRRALSKEEVVAMECLNHILTGTMSSRILGAARKRGLVYGVFSAVMQDEKMGSWEFGGEVGREKAKDLFELMAKEVRKVLADGVTEEELAAAKSYALGRFQMGAQTVGQAGNFYAGEYFLSGEVEDYEAMPKMISAVKAEDIRELAREFAGSGISGFGVVANLKQVEVNEFGEIFQLN